MLSPAAVATGQIRLVKRYEQEGVLSEAEELLKSHIKIESENRH